MTKAGYVALTGKPNAGKSTLMNTCLGTKLSIVTPKPQTTRKRVLGIYSTDNCQIVFHDTPGLLKPRYEMQRSMMRYVDESLGEVDVIAYILDASEYVGRGITIDDAFVNRLDAINKPKLLLLNKTDLLHDKKALLPLIEKYTGHFDEIIPVSAISRKDAEYFLEVAEKYMPESPFFYDPEIISSQNERFFVSEIIREHIFMQFQEEIPYSTEVTITDFSERDDEKWYIAADIIVDRKSQKGILIGKGGAKIKEIGQKSRADIENHLGAEVFLDLFVKIREKWRDNENMLRSFGY